jgi:AAA15 family ATPase/GTPase
MAKGRGHSTGAPPALARAAARSATSRRGGMVDGVGSIKFKLEVIFFAFYAKIRMKNKKIMLIQFSVANYRSILERQTLSMVASNYFAELVGQNTCAPDAGTGVPSLLRSAVLYGPNASGKSSVIEALRFMQKQVLDSHKESQAGDAIEVSPFKLTAQSRNADTEFEITFVEQGVRYEYGFCCNKIRFTEEWLIAYPLGRAQKWFHRVVDPKTSTDVYKFSPTFLGGKQRHKIWTDSTRPNALFFSKAIQSNNEQLKPAFDWFKSRLRVIHSVEKLSDGFTRQQFKDDEKREKIVAFMSAADPSISDIRLRETEFSIEALPNEIPTQLKQIILRDLNLHGKKSVELRFFRNDVNTENAVEFSVQEESDGTRSLFNLAGPWLDVIENQRVLVVDELDTSLHPLLVHHLVKQLHHAGSHAQLIFTTHDTTLLSQKLLRRDQVWFLEKDAQSASRLYPLSDFSPRDNEAIERGYLNGRYGSIPFLKDLDFYAVR